MTKSFTRYCWILLLLASNYAHGQNSSPDSSWVSAAVNGLRQHYNAARHNDESRLYNGPEYVSHLPDYLTGHPFYASVDLLPATVEYDGTRYEEVPLRYDLMRDVLVLQAPQGELELVSENVARFTLEAHTFVRVVVDSTSDSALKTGFYDLLVDGPVRVLAARKKSMQKRSVAQGMEGEITQKNTLFIGKGGRYYPANSASQVLHLFPEHKLALRKYVKAENLTFRGSRREEDVTALVRYQATLAPPAGPAPSK